MSISQVRSAAEQQLAARGRYSITVKIGIAYHTFTVRCIGRHGYTLHKGNDIVEEYGAGAPGPILAALYDQIQMYI